MMKLVCAVVFAFLGILVAGQDVYDRSTQVCCDGKIHDKRRGLHCCGQETYNFMDKACCGNQIIDYPNEIDEQFGCCMNTEDGQYYSYDYLSQQCCGGEIVVKPETGKFYECCGKELFSYETYSCCGGNIVEKSDNMQCCGDQMITIESGIFLKCCDGEIIDIDTQICCSTYDHNMQAQTHTTTEKVYDITTDGDQCCGLDIYNSTTEVCCYKMESGFSMNYLLPKPAGLDRYDHPFCCGDEVLFFSRSLRMRNADRACCAGFGLNSESVSYDTETELCCAGIVKPKDSDNPNQESCCWSSQEFYDDETQICTVAGVKAKFPIEDEGGLSTVEDYCVPNRSPWKLYN